ncbi:MAG TPA: AAA family ATPase [Puia sp.]|jgi:hypothetical protein|nr:AAA family ATPase [Puia sp.]
MRIAAVNIPARLLSPVFRQDRPNITINLGGQNIYTFLEDDQLEVKPNPFFLEDIFGNQISLFSCIVGENGRGKSTILRLMTSSHDCSFVIEQSDGRYSVTNDIDHIHRVYYTPYLHQSVLNAIGNNGKDLSKLALLKTDNHGDTGLLDDFMEAHHSENSKRWIRFNHFYRQSHSKPISLPVFDHVKLSIRHFDASVHNPDSFHDTSYQLRPAIMLLFNKMQQEQQDKEHLALGSRNLGDKESDKTIFRIRFEYDIYEAAIAKLVSILERAGNRFLSEGFIPNNWTFELNSRSVREGIEWFLRNAGVYSDKDRYSFHQHLQLLDLIDYTLSVADDEGVTENWREIIISEAEALQIIQKFDYFNNSFQGDWFKYDEKPMFGFEPQLAVSSGEQQFLNLFSTLYFHAQNIGAGIDIDLHSFDSLKYIDKDILLLLDEGDNAFHPQWKKEYVRYLRNIMPSIFPNLNIQIIITSHDPLTLSDLPKNNVIFLEKGIDGTIIGNSTLKRTFGANVADLLKDSFFLQDGQIGNFVADVIDKMISDMENRTLSEIRIQTIERIINTLDEPIMKIKLAEKLSNATGNRVFERKLLDDEIERLRSRRDHL